MEFSVPSSAIAFVTWNQTGEYSSMRQRQLSFIGVVLT